MEQPTENVKLSFEQLQAEDVSKKRLANLESEISISTKNLKILKGDTDRATKENIYQNELLAVVTLQVNEKKGIATKLDEDILGKRADLNKLLADIKEHSAKIEADKMALKDREDSVKQEEEKLSNHEKAVVELTNERQKEEEIFNAKVAKLKEVISTF